MQKSFKKIYQVFVPPVVSEGQGAKVRRIIGDYQLPRFDPFLVLDYFTIRLPDGFPDHPHRGFETVTYMLSGSVNHEDFKGNKGTISSGDVQWMTAGKGIMHAEMPGSSEEYSVGFQLWINLAAKDKFVDPQYQEIKKDKIPIATQDGINVKVIAGGSLGQKGPIYARTPALYLDIEMEKNSKFEQDIPKGWNSMVFVYEGKAIFGPEKTEAGLNTSITFRGNKREDETINVETGDSSVKFIMIAGQALKENVVHHGPFVLSTQDDLAKTFEDFEKGENGFENAPGWESKIKDLKH